MKPDYTRVLAVSFAYIVADYAKKLGLPKDLFNMESELYIRIIKSVTNCRISSALFTLKGLATFCERNYLTSTELTLLRVVDYSLALANSTMTSQEVLDWVFSHKEEAFDAGLGHQFTTIRIPVIRENKTHQWYYPSYEYRIFHNSFPHVVCQKESLREAANSLIDQIRKTCPLDFP